MIHMLSGCLWQTGLPSAYQKHLKVMANTSETVSGRENAEQRVRQPHWPGEPVLANMAAVPRSNRTLMFLYISDSGQVVSAGHSTATQQWSHPHAGENRAAPPTKFIHPYSLQDCAATHHDHACRPCSNGLQHNPQDFSPSTWKGNCHPQADSTGSLAFISTDQR